MWFVWFVRFLAHEIGIYGTFKTFADLEAFWCFALFTIPVGASEIGPGNSSLLLGSD